MEAFELPQHCAQEGWHRQYAYMQTRYDSNMIVDVLLVLIRPRVIFNTSGSLKLQCLYCRTIRDIARISQIYDYRQCIVKWIWCYELSHAIS